MIPVSKPKFTSEEGLFREVMYPGGKGVLDNDKTILCTSCGGSIRHLVASGRPVSHPFLETLLCEKCDAFYGDGNFAVDEKDGSDIFCRWCGQGGTLFLCSICTAGFCQKCIKRNLSRDALADIKQKNDWSCFCCNAKPIYALRATCWAALKLAEEMKVGSDSVNEDKKIETEENIGDETEKRQRNSKASKPDSGKLKRKRKSKNQETDSDNDKSRNKKRKVSKENDHDKLRINIKNVKVKSEKPKDRRSIRRLKSEADESTEFEEKVNIPKNKAKLIENKYNDCLNKLLLVMKDCQKKAIALKRQKMGNTVEDIKILYLSCENLVDNCIAAMSNVKQSLDDSILTLENETEQINGANKSPENNNASTSNVSNMSNASQQLEADVSTDSENNLNGMDVDKPKSPETETKTSHTDGNSEPMEPASSSKPVADD